MNRIYLIMILVLFNGVLKSQNDKILLDAYGYLYSKNYFAAIKSFDDLISSSSNPRAEDILNRGVAAFLSGSYPAAENDLINAARKGQTEGYLWLARLHVVAGDYGKASGFLKQYLRTDEYPKVDVIKKDSLFRRMHVTEEWMELWQDGDNAGKTETISRIELLASAGKFQEAHKLLEDLINDGNTKAAIRNSSLHLSEGNKQLALNEMNNALLRNPSHTGLLKQKSTILMELSYYANAYDLLTKILAENPGDFNSRFTRARAAMYSGHLQEAKKDIEIFMKYLQHEDAVFLAGEIEFKSGRYMNALKYYNQLLAGNSSNASYFKARGKTYYHTNTFSQAAYDLSMSLDLVPDDAEANYFLGLAQERLGNRKMACYYLNRANSYGDNRAYDYIRANCGR